MSGCRIGAVRMKAGGAAIVPLRAPERSEAARTLVEYAVATTDAHPGMAGFVVFAWDHDGKSTVSSHLAPGGNVSPSMLPAFVAARLRKEWDV